MKRKAHLKRGHTTVTEVVDKTTGELISTNVKSHKYLANSKEEFMLLYVSVLPIFIELSHPAKSVYAYILANYNSGAVFELGGGSRGFIASKLGIGNSTVANALSELKEQNLICVHSRSMYQINPRYAFKGSSTDRSQALKAIIELGCRDC